MSNTHVNPDTRLLDETIKNAHESEQISIHIYDQLRQQREQLNRASLALHDTDDSMARSNVLLRNMIRRAQANRAVTTAIIIGLASLVLIAIYIKLFG